MEKILIFIKHHFTFLWGIIDWGNGLLFLILYRSKMGRVLKEVLSEVNALPLSYRGITSSDLTSLNDLLNSQNNGDLDYFKPHGFDMGSLKRQLKNQSFLMMGSFDGEKLIGYFFLRFFINKKCFVGRLIDKQYRGKGIGQVMNNIMYETAWRMGFRCMSTISRNNLAVMRAHAKNPAMIVLKELQNNYLLVEFIRSEPEAQVSEKSIR